ncbi:hypothetical protein F5B22DRAFT_435845 [Xylaria bambusicola]|uniref:uncharacterized protein n=1 Tax=Xylaria bambusicola TaxID=326684 RepID=UPI0020083643|nr:uncharacterized protein F5B22DRAFT_435845 [Xylaria bambusicola]KAI0506743.1 hypothetical protein F5B22DRAFT_435845 [Xylaria bambusicola]
MQLRLVSVALMMLAHVLLMIGIHWRIAAIPASTLSFWCFLPLELRLELPRHVDVSLGIHLVCSYCSRVPIPRGIEGVIPATDRCRCDTATRGEFTQRVDCKPM